MPAKPLSPTMRLALASVVAEPGMPAAQLPGGTRTVGALMRRWLVEVAGEDWRVYAPEHRHEFRTTMRLDSCHSYSSQARCSCGAVYRFYGERSIKGDPCSAIWMMNDDGDGSVCERCQQLLDGAPVRYQMVIARG